MSLNRDRLGAGYGPVRLSVDPEQVSAYADATADPLPRYRGPDTVAPPVFGIVPVWPAIRQAIADDGLGVDVGRIVHGEQRMTFHRLIRAGDELTSSGALSSITERGENEVFVLSFETRDAGGSLVTTQDVVCVSRGTAKPKPEQAAPPSVRTSEEATPREPDLVRRVDLPADVTFRYAHASGDDNRIHVDDDFARSVGLPGIIVQGMCLFSIALQAVVEAAASGRPDLLRTASVRFRKPLQPGSTFETLVYLDRDGIRFEGRGEDGQAVLTGTAAVGDEEPGTTS
jgi:acyl dehydratase